MNRLIIEVWHEYKTVKEATISYYDIIMGRSNASGSDSQTNKGLKLLTETHHRTILQYALAIKIITVDWYREDECPEKNTVIQRCLDYDTKHYGKNWEAWIKNIEYLLTLGKNRKSCSSIKVSGGRFQDTDDYIKTKVLDDVSRGTVNR